MPDDSLLYLVQYGRTGFLGRFQAPVALARGERVVVDGPRGRERGEVLLALDPSFGSTVADGTVLGSSADREETLVADGDGSARDLLAAASVRAEELGLPLAFVDVEVLLEGTVVLHALHWADCDATPLLDELSQASGRTVRLLDLTRAPTSAPSSTSCGKPGCGSEGGGCSSCGEGGGCSTGSCSRGSVKSSSEMTAYFADLRAKMEVAGLARRPLH